MITSVRGLRARLRADDTLSRKASLNMFAALVDYAARVLVALAVSPVLVSRLGDVAFGIYQVLTRLINYATPAGGRPSQALKWTIARHQHSTAFDEKRLQVGCALAVWILFLPLLATAGGILAWFAPVIVGAPDSLYLTIRVTAGVLVADLILTNLVTIPQSVVQGENLGYKRLGLSTAVVVIGGGLAAAAVLLGWGLIGVAAAAAATTTLSGLVFLWVSRRNVSWFGVARPPWRAVRVFLNLSGWFLLWNLIAQIMRGGDIVVLGIVGSAELVTVYVLARYVPEAIFGAVAIGISGIMPGLGGLLGAQETRRAADVRSESMTLTWLIATASGATFLLWHASFLSLWVGEEYVPERIAMLLIVALMLQLAFIRNDASIIDLTLELRAKVLLGLVSAAASVALAVVLVRGLDLGLAGVAAGFLAGRVLLTVSYPWLVCGHLGLPFAAEVRAAARPLAVCVALYVTTTLASSAADTGSWLVLVVAAALTFTAIASLAFRIGLTGRQRRRLVSRARGLV